MDVFIDRWQASDEPQRFDAELGTRGRVVVPAAVRSRLDLNPGDRLVVTVRRGGDG